MTNAQRSNTFRIPPGFRHIERERRSLQDSALRVVLLLLEEDVLWLIELIDVYRTWTLQERQAAASELSRTLEGLVKAFGESQRQNCVINLNVAFGSSGDSLTSLAQRWLSQQPLHFSVESNGKICALPLMPPFLASSEPVEFGRGLAMHLFFEVINSPGQGKGLAICHKCRLCFVRDRIRQSTSNHIFCGRCGPASRTAEARARRKSDLTSTAADVWPDRWTPTLQFPTLAAFVFDRMTKKRPRLAAQIRPKWVAQNKREIEAEVERRKNAKS